MPPQINSFFEFNERLEAILTKAYIYRSAATWWYLPALQFSLVSLSVSSSSFVFLPWDAPQWQMKVPGVHFIQMSVSQGDPHHHLSPLLSPLQRLSVLLGLCLQWTRINQVGVQWRGQQVGGINTHTHTDMHKHKKKNTHMRYCISCR